MKYDDFKLWMQPFVFGFLVTVIAWLLMKALDCLGGTVLTGGC